jgi:5-methylcytosine-specific restriction endonuclease McrA
MKKHIKIYIKTFDYGEQDFMECEVCSARAVDVHHIDIKGMGGCKQQDHIDNLIGLCRSCHDKAHNHKLSKEELHKIHELKLSRL